MNNAKTFGRNDNVYYKRNVIIICMRKYTIYTRLLQTFDAYKGITNII